MLGAQVVRKPLITREESSRTLDERLAVRFPRRARESSRRVLRLRPSSRVRQAFVWRTARQTLEAYNRRDLDAVVAAWEPDCEYHPDAAWVKAGLVEPSYRGPDGYRAYVAGVDEVWAGENYVITSELIDLGDRLVVLGEGLMRGEASGVPLNEAFSLVSTVEDGRLIRHQEYYDHAKALEAVGLER